MAIDPNQMEAFAGPKPGEEVLDELDDAEMQGEPIVDQGRLDELVPLLLDNADYFEDCCDELDQDQLANTSEDLDAANQEILSDAVMSVPDDEVFDELVSVLGDLDEEEIGALASRLEEEGVDDSDRLANLVAHISRLIDSGVISQGEDEEESEDEEEDDEEDLEDDLDEGDELDSGLTA